jgi:hypothetical protein
MIQINVKNVKNVFDEGGKGGLHDDVSAGR